MLAYHLTRLFRQGRFFSILGPGDCHFHVAGTQCAPVVPSFALLVPPASSPYLDANAGIGPRAAESPDCSTLQYTSDEPDVGRGTIRAIGGRGLLEICWSQALARRR